MGKPITRKQVWSPESARRYTRRRIARARSGNRPTLWSFARWLEESRGLSAATVTVRIGCASTFVDAMTLCTDMSCTRALRLITADAVEDFFVEYGKDHGMPARRSMQAAMRLFLEFAALRGWLSRELVGAVPSLASYRLSSLPTAISDKELSRILTLRWEGGLCPLRDRAIVWLLAIYGARRGQISALCLNDIDWRERIIELHGHKGGKAVRHRLTESVAEVLAEYLSKERPRVACDEVFLRCRRPYMRLAPGAISTMVQARMKQFGLPPVHAHAFRHAFATRLLRTGQPIKAIADLLGHRSLAAVAIYAKLDHPRLFEAAADWPEVAP